MTSAIRKKLIEISIPLEAIDAEARRRKQKAPKGYPTAIHKYWAQRPIAACRAVIFAQHVDDPSSWPDRFVGEESQERERKRLHDLIKRLVIWEISENVLREARWEIARSVAWGLAEEPPPKNDGHAIIEYLSAKAPPVYDPFCGAGSIPLEAQRLGLRAYGSDLNPIAVLISKALVEIPPKFAGRPPINPKAQAELRRGGRWNGEGANGIAEDVRYYGEWMREEAEKRIGRLYPKAKLPNGSSATVIAWLWVRTVRSPDPAAKGAMVPLLTTFMLSTKEGRKAWLEPVIQPHAEDGYRFEVKGGKLSKADEDRLKKGTKTGHGSNFRCLLTGATITGDYLKAEGQAGRLKTRLIAVVAEENRRRVFLEPTKTHSDAALGVDCTEVLNTATSRHPQYMGCVPYGLDDFGKIFTSRQQVALSTLASLVGDVRNMVINDATRCDPERGLPLCNGGSNTIAYADAIATYLALIIGRMAEYSSSLASWLTDDNALRGTFGRQAMSMVWDFAEGNPFGQSSAAISQCVSVVAAVVAACPALGEGKISQASAQSIQYEGTFSFATDPPYYDNVPYADLSDYFYVWLRPALSGIWPELFRRISTPKDEELVADVVRHGGRATAELFFMTGMKDAFDKIQQATANGTVITVYYAFRQAESTEEGVTSAGWASFLQALLECNLAIDGTWPLRTESAGRMRGNRANALASSIVLVCRKRDSTASIITRAEFIRALKRELPRGIEDIRRAGVGPVDMQQSIIGPGMGMFTRYAKVLEDDDSTMSVKTALTLINRVWEEIENELEANFDAETQVALAWFSTYGFDSKPSGELITLANAKNIPLNALFSSKVFQDYHGKAGLTPRDKLSEHWQPGRERSPTVWECLQHTIRTLKAEEGGAEAAGRLIARIGPKAADARLLAERLYQIAAQKGWQQEALVYNELAQEWPTLEEFAQNITMPDGVAEPVQARLL